MSLPTVENYIANIIKGFVIQFDPAVHHDNIEGNKMFSNSFFQTRFDGLNKYPMVAFDYDAKYEVSFANRFESLAGNTAFSTKVWAGMEFPKIKVEFFLDVSKGQEQTSSFRNTVPPDSKGAGILTAVTQSSLSSAGSQLFGGLNLLEVGIQPILDAYETMVKPPISYNGISSLCPCIMFLGLQRMYVGYMENLSYSVEKTAPNGVPTRASGSFTFEVHPYLQQYIAGGFNRFMAMFMRILGRSLKDIAKETGVKIISSMVTDAKFPVNII